MAWNIKTIDNFEVNHTKVMVFQYSYLSQIAVMNKLGHIKDLKSGKIFSFSGLIKDYHGSIIVLYLFDDLKKVITDIDKLKDILKYYLIYKDCNPNILTSYNDLIEHMISKKLTVKEIGNKIMKDYLNI